MAEVPVCLRDQGIDDGSGGVSRVRQACRLSDDNGDVGRGQVIHDASKGLTTTAEAAGAR